MRVVETFVRAKSGDERTCEDRITATDAFVFVFDGATDKSGASFDGLPGGRFAVETLERAVKVLPPNITAMDCVEYLTAELDRAVHRSQAPQGLPADWPSAVFVAYSHARREIWRVGDCIWATDKARSVPHKELDHHASRLRAALLRALIEQGDTVEHLRQTDPGRAMILPLLREQFQYRNATWDKQFGYGAVDGTPVPAAYVETVDAGGCECVLLASDGYPRVYRHLEACENYLARDLARDPLRIYRHPTTKGVGPGQVSFDDRAYVRITT